MEKNPKVEVAFIRQTTDPSQMEALRISGVAQIINDPNLAERLFTERPWLRDFEKIAPDSRPVIFRIANGEAYFWNMGVNMREDSVERVRI